MPRVLVRSWSSCPTCHASSGAMGRPHRQQVALPAWTRGARARRRRWWSVPYPRCLRLPRLASCALVCSGHRVTPAGTGRAHPWSRHGCMARAMSHLLEQHCHPLPISGEGGRVGPQGVAYADMSHDKPGVSSGGTHLCVPLSRAISSYGDQRCESVGKAWGIACCIGAQCQGSYPCSTRLPVRLSARIGRPIRSALLPVRR